MTPAEWTMQPAEADRPICPECGHEDDPAIGARVGVGGSAIMFCDGCGLVWLAVNVGTRWVGPVGHGRAIPLFQNRRLRADHAGNLRLLYPAKYAAAPAPDEGPIDQSASDLVPLLRELFPGINVQRVTQAQIDAAEAERERRRGGCAHCTCKGPEGSP